MNAAEYRSQWEQTYPDVPYGFCVCGCGEKTTPAKQTHTGKGYVKGEPVSYVSNHHNDRKLSGSQEADLCRRYSEGEKPKILAKAFGLSIPGFFKVLNRNGVPRRYWQRIPKDSEETIYRRYLAGDKIADITADFGINFTTIYDILQRRGAKATRTPKRLEWEEVEATKIIRRLPAYRQWRKAVLRRDNRRCQQCGAESTFKNPLHVHHLLSFASILAECRPIRVDEAERYTALWDTDNGITLCAGCHRKAHTIAS